MDIVTRVRKGKLVTAFFRGNVALDGQSFRRSQRNSRGEKPKDVVFEASSEEDQVLQHERHASGATSQANILRICKVVVDLHDQVFQNHANIQHIISTQLVVAYDNLIR